MPEMKTLTIGNTTYTIVDEEARKTVANLLDKTEVTVWLTDMTGYLLKISGKVVASSTGNVKRIVSEPVYASAGDKYTITCSANYGNALYVIYDSSGAVLSYEIADSTESGTILSNTEIIMPENTSYFRLASNLDNNPTGYSAAKIVLVPATTGKGKWSGIKWVVIGDSLTEKNKRTTKHYYDYIAEQTGITVEVMGVSGSGYVAGKDDGDAFYQRVASIPTDADVITIFGSGNDLSAMESLSLSMGTGADTGSASPTTVAGYVANAIQAIYDALPTVQLGIIAPTPWQYHSPADADDDMSKYADMLKDVCAKRGIPYLDLFRCSGLRPWDAEFRTLAYSKDDGDGTHPDEMGHAMIAPHIKEFLGTMLYQDSPVAVGSSGDRVTLGITGASVGQLAKITAVDAEGKPTAWESVNIPVGGGGITDINIKKWFGKKIVVDGSSITSGGTGNTKPTWWSFVKDMFALDTVYDHSLSGSNWLYGSTYASSYSRLSDYEADADAIILMGDFSSSYTSLGAITDVANVTGDTYYARLKGYAEALIAKYPLCPIIWVIEPPRNWDTPNDPNGRGNTIASALKAVAELYGFPVADCLHKNIFRQYNEANYAATTSDGTHPWNNIQRTMAQIIAETMKETPLFYNESYVVTPDAPDSGGTDEPEGATVTALTVTPVSGYTLFENDTLEDVKDAINVIATYSDLSEAKISNYTVTGDLTAGAQTFTIAYEGVSATVELTVTAGERTVTVSLADIAHTSDYILNDDDAECSMTGCAYSDYIAVAPGSNVTLLWSNSGWRSMINYYDMDKARVGFIKGVYGSNREYALPETAYYIRVNGALDLDGTPVQVITYVPG